MTSERESQGNGGMADAPGSENQRVGLPKQQVSTWDSRIKASLGAKQGMETAFVHEVPKAGSKQHPAPHQQPWKWEYRNNAAPSSSPSARKHGNTETMQTLQHPLHAFFDSRSNHQPSVRLSWKIVSHSSIHKLRNTVRSDSSDSEVVLTWRTTERPSPPLREGKSKQRMPKIHETNNLIQAQSKGIPHLMVQEWSRMTGERQARVEQEDQGKNYTTT